jgi:hypothetical protein
LLLLSSHPQQQRWLFLFVRHFQTLRCQLLLLLLLPLVAIFRCCFHGS